jgi:hypothetical protein
MASADATGRTSREKLIKANPFLERFTPAHPELALRRSQQQQTAIRQLIAASKINCEFLAPDRWKVEGKQRIVAHGGCGGGLMHVAIADLKSWADRKMRVRPL